MQTPGEMEGDRSAIEKECVRATTKVMSERRF